MKAAIIAAVLTVVVAAAIIVGIFVLRARRSKDKSSHKTLEPLTSIGSATPFQTRETKAMAGSNYTETGVNDSLAERLKPRYTALAVLIAGVFGSLTAKLWSMQVLSSEEYAEEADENQYTTIKTSAPRGRIFDAEGIVLVDNETVPTVLADADVADDRAVLMRLSALLGIPYAVVRQRVRDETGGAQAQREVSANPRDRDVAFIVEHPDAFSGVEVEERTYRVYPYRALAGQVLGYTGEVSDDDLENGPEGTDYQSGDEIGKSGVEYTFDNYLTGTHGERVVVTDADGDVHEVKSETPATQGNDVYLTISARVQSLAEQLLADLIAPSGVIGYGTGTSGALVAMEVDTGDVIAMASFPSFDPSHFVGGVSQDDWDRYVDEDFYSPLMNRCIAGQYPAASTFKAFTGLAGLHYGFAGDSTSVYCSGTWTGFGEDYAQNCWETSGHGTIALRRGVVVSCDVVFYEIAKSFYYASDEVGETALQEFVENFGLGSTTGIALSGEASGVIPTPEWKEEYYADSPEEGQWQAGDLSNMVIGQGNVLVTPLQLAVGYAGVATGVLPVPNLLKEVRNSSGETVVTPTYETREIPEVTEEEFEFMRDALRGVATENSTMSTLFADYDYKPACKTGTGEWEDHDGYAWFAMYAPYDDPKYVVTCVIQEGGAGGTVAAPIAAEVMEACIAFGEGTLATDVEASDEISGSVEYSGTGAGRAD